MMGQRGPGAKPTIKTSKATPQGHLFEAPPPVNRQQPWEEPDLSRAERLIKFIETLPVTSGMLAGQNMRLRTWQKQDIIAPIYRTNSTGKRVVRTALVTMPRKNGKTALAAALALAHLVGPEAELRGQVYSAASDRDQAAIIFRELEAIITAIPELAQRCNIQRFAKRIEDTETGSIYQALSADGRKAHGLSASFVVYDELAQASGRALYDNLVTSTGARAEPLMVVISTQSSDPHHIMSELVRYGMQVRDGEIEDPTFCPVIYAAGMEDDPWDESTWFASNPALGDFRSIEEMRQFAAQAKRIPAREAAFRNLYLNQPVDVEQRFISSADWDACGGLVDPELLRGRPCWAGLDLSSTTDLTALVLYFPEDDGALLSWFWVPGDNLDLREEKDKVPYRTWAKNGLIEAPTGRAINRRAIAFRLAAIASTYDLKGVAYDRWRIEDLKAILADEGIELPLVAWGQGFRDMGPAVDVLEAAVLDTNIRHGGHPVLTWNCANAVVQLDPAGARKISKQKSIERVDGIVALTMAVGLHAREPKPMEYDFSRPLVLTV